MIEIRILIIKHILRFHETSPTTRLIALWLWKWLWNAAISTLYYFSRSNSFDYRSLWHNAKVQIQQGRQYTSRNYCRRSLNEAKRRCRMRSCVCGKFFSFGFINTNQCHLTKLSPWNTWSIYINFNTDSLFFIWIPILFLLVAFISWKFTPFQLIFCKFLVVW